MKIKKWEWAAIVVFAGVIGSETVPDGDLWPALF